MMDGAASTVVVAAVAIDRAEGAAEINVDRLPVGSGDNPSQFEKRR